MSKPKWSGWKEGVLSKTLESMGGNKHRKGTTVRYRRFKQFADPNHTWNGKYEWHYLDTDNTNLIRTTEFLIE